MPVQDHVHQYRKITQGKDKKYIIFRCTKRNCSHFVPKDFFVGKEAECPNCFKTFVVGTEKWHMQRAYPNCGCQTITKTRRKLAAEIESNSSSIDDMLAAIVKGD